MTRLTSQLRELPRRIAGNERIRQLLVSEGFRRWLPAVVFILLGVLALWLTTNLLLGLHDDLQEEPFPVDRQLLALVRQYTPAWIGPLLVLLTDALHARRGLVLVIAAWIVAGVWLWRRDRWREVAGSMVALVVSSVSVALAKIAFERPRPSVAWALTNEPSFSFPSGHAATAVVIYGMAAYLVWRLSRRWQIGLFSVVLALFLAFGTGYSRIYLGVHYPTDVAAGFAVGGIWLTAGILTTEALHLLRGLRRQPSWPEADKG